MKPKVSIIVLNWNGKEDTIECFESLKHITYPNYEILLVDNGSTDDSIEFFREYYKNTIIISNGKNLGFAEGNNVAIRKAINKGTDYVLLLNNDTVVDPSFLDELIDVAESDKKIGIVGPTIYNYNSLKIQSAGLYFQWDKGKGRRLRYNEIDKGDFDHIIEVDYVSGCALLAKRELIEKIGYLNKYYFAYWEETEWCIRARKQLYKVLYAPKSKIWHKGGCTSIRKSTGFQEYQLARNRFWFMKKHATKKQYLSFLLYGFMFEFWALGIFYALKYKNINVIISFLRGIKHGLKTFN